MLIFRDTGYDDAHGGSHSPDHLLVASRNADARQRFGAPSHFIGTILILLLIPSLLMATLLFIYVTSRVRKHRRWLALAHRNADHSGIDSAEESVSNYADIPNPWRENHHGEDLLSFDAIERSNTESQVLIDIEAPQESFAPIPTFNSLNQARSVGLDVQIPIMGPSPNDDHLISDPINRSNPKLGHYQKYPPVITPQSSSFEMNSTRVSLGLAEERNVFDCSSSERTLAPTGPTEPLGTSYSPSLLAVNTSSRNPQCVSSLDPIAYPNKDDQRRDDDNLDDADEFFDAISSPLGTPAIASAPLPHELKTKESSTENLLLTLGATGVAEAAAAAAHVRSIAASMAEETSPDPEGLLLPQTDNLPIESRTREPTPSLSLPAHELQTRKQQQSSSTLLRRHQSTESASRPAWCTRALDAPALGIPANSSSSNPMASSHSSAVASSSLSPEIRSTLAVRKDQKRLPPAPMDVALAMQLRPGLGLGADAAWMVRFLMAMFGWFAVLLSAQGGPTVDRKQQRARLRPVA